MKRVLFPLFLSFLVLAAAASAQTLIVTPTQITLDALEGTTAAVSQQITVGSSSSTAAYLVYNTNTANTWLGISTSSGGSVSSSLNLTAPDTFYIVANPTTLPTGTYTGQVMVVGPGSSTPVNITFVVSTVGLGAQLPIALSYQQNSSTFPQATLPLTGASTSYTVTVPSGSGCAWLLVPSTGFVPSTLTISLNTAVAVTLTANTYDCSFTLTPQNAPNTSLTIPVVLTVSTAPTITLTPSSIAMNYQNGTTSYPSQSVTITSNGTVAVPYSLQLATTDANYTGAIWFTTSKTSGTLTPPGNTDSFTVSYNGVPLAPATYHGQITLTADNAQQVIPVTLLVSSSPLLNVSPSAVTFTAESYGSAPAPVTVEATITSGSSVINVGSITYTNGSGWLTAGTGAPTTSGTPITLSVNPSGLAIGKYQATVQVIDNSTANSPQNISVTLNVANDPLISTNVSATQGLTFAFQTGTSATAPAAQTVTVSSTTGATLSYAAMAANTTPAGGCPGWLSLTGNTTGNTSGSFSVGASPTGISATTTAGTPTCTGTITITATNTATNNAAPNSPYVIPVSFYVSANALLVVTPDAAPAFTAQVGLASSVVSQNCATNGTSSCNLTVASTSATDPVSISITTSTADGATWLYALPTNATLPVNGSSTALIVGLATSAIPTTPGSYSGVVTIKASTQSGSAVLDSPLNIPVSLQVIAGAPTASPTSLTFSQTLGGSVATQNISVGSSTSSPISFTAAATTTSGGNWLTVTPTSGTSPATLTVSVSDANLTSSTTPYQGSITITAAGSSNTVTVPVSFTVSPGTISANQTSLTFSQVAGGSAPAAQTINVSGTPGALNFTAAATTTSGGNWLTVSPTSGTTPGTVSVSVSAGSLTAGPYSGTVTITSTGASGSPISIPVSLTVLAPQTLSVSPSTLSFTAIAGQTSPSAQTASVTSSGSGTSFTAAATTASGGNWLSVSPTSGVTPAQLTISVSTQSLTAANYTGTITINSPNASAAVTLTVNLTVSSIPTPVITAVQNAASYAIGGISPGENIYIKGTGIGPSTLTVAAPNASGLYPTTLGSTQVFFGSVAAPILYVSATATSVMVPYEVAGQPTTSVTVVYSGVSSSPLTYNVVSSAPGIYTLNESGTGPGAILNSNYSINGSTAPAAAGSVVAVYMTGEGTTSPSSTDGLVAPTNGTGLNKPTQTVTATIGGVNAPVQYYGSAPGIIYGVMQVNLTVPAGLSSGTQPIVITVGNASSQAQVTINVQGSTASDVEQ